MTDHACAPTNLPYTIATLCELRDKDGRTLLLHRKKHPNRDLYSPVGGKLETGLGESPAQCAAREVKEETGLDIAPEGFHLLGIIAERAFMGKAHWLMFWFRAIEPVDPAALRHDSDDMEEGRLEWHAPEKIDELPLPETDREVIWPMVRKHSPDGFFSVSIDCRGEQMTWTVDESRSPAM